MRACGCFYDKEKRPLFPLSQFWFCGNCTLLSNLLCNCVKKNNQSRGLGIHFARCWLTGRRGRLLWHVICTSCLNSGFCPPFHCLTFNCLKASAFIVTCFPSSLGSPNHRVLSCDCIAAGSRSITAPTVFSYAQHGPTYHDFATEGKLRKEAQAKENELAGHAHQLGEIDRLFVRFFCDSSLRERHWGKGLAEVGQVDFA